MPPVPDSHECRADDGRDGRLARERETLQVVDDQIGQPTWTKDLAAYVVKLVTAKRPGGHYHGTSSGQTSWCGFTREIAVRLGSRARKGVHHS